MQVYVIWWLTFQEGKDVNIHNRLVFFFLQVAKCWDMHTNVFPTSFHIAIFRVPNSIHASYR